MAKTRKFTGYRKGQGEFEVETELTDKQALTALGAQVIAGALVTDPEASKFVNDCARELFKMMVGLDPRTGLIAWAFKIAEGVRNPKASMVTLPAALLAIVGPRRPLRGETFGRKFQVSYCGPNSKHHGSYAITDGGAFRANEFYGYATPEGVWKPTNATPPEVVTALMAVSIK